MKMQAIEFTVTGAKIESLLVGLTLISLNLLIALRDIMKNGNYLTNYCAGKDGEKLD